MRPTDKNAGLAIHEPDLARGDVENLQGDFRALLKQVGHPGLAPDLDGLFIDGDATPVGAAKFLEYYLSCLLVPCELPSIVTAYRHARQGEVRELLALDQHLASRLRVTPFAQPSRQIGRSQLTRLRPLRDDRVVQRYLAAVDAEQANGWHTLVYGVTLAVYSLPLRQGLFHYSQETLRALTSAAARSNGASLPETSELLSNALGNLPAAVESALAGQLF